MPRDPAKRRAELREDVALMRDLGVARWGAIFLGPPPMKPGIVKVSAVDELERDQRRIEREHNTLFASSSVRPPVPKSKLATSAEHVVQRVTDAHEHDGGTQQ